LEANVFQRKATYESMQSANNLQSPRFHRTDGFTQLPTSSHSNIANMQHLEEIPLEKVVTGGSVTGARKPSSTVGNTTAVGSSDGSDGLRPRLGRRKTANGIDGSEMDAKLSSSDDGAVNRMGRIYQKIVNFSVITRYLIYVLPVAGLIAIPIAIGFTAARKTRVGGVRMVWFFIWLEAGMFEFLIHKLYDY
jgi:hypothetical protein